jgi:hypothetical protein
MNLKIFVAAACAALAVSGGAAQTTPSPGDIASRLTANDLKADVSFLASDALQGRGTPSPGLDIAAEFVAAEFRRAGLEAAGDDGYFQTAKYVSVTSDLDGLQLTLEIGGQSIQAEKGFLALQEPAAADLNRVQVFKTAIGDSSSVTEEQVRGKVLVIELPAAGEGRGGRGTFAAVRLLPGLAEKHPALILLLGSGGPRGGNPAARLREAQLPPPSVPIVMVTGGAMRKSLAAAKPGPVDATISAHIAAPSVVPVKLRNVVGVLRGSDPALKETYVMLTAHYDHLGVRGAGEGDHIYNGANDDASGTASVIEVAHTLASLPVRPKRSIVFVGLFGEELGLLGSRYYAAHPVFPLSKTVADINLEQVGRTDDVTGPRVGLLNLTGYDFTSLTGVFRKAGKETGIKVVKDEESSDQFFARSDNQAFADAGIPSHTLSVGYVFPDYHQPGDKWQKIDYENMAKVDRAVALAIFLVADNAEAPQWNAANPKTERYVHARGSSGTTPGTRPQ